MIIFELYLDMFIFNKNFPFSLVTTDNCYSDTGRAIIVSHYFFERIQNK